MRRLSVASVAVGVVLIAVAAAAVVWWLGFLVLGLALMAFGLLGVDVEEKP